MSLNKYTDQEYYSQYEGGAAPDDFDGLGSYQYVKLPAIIDNFLLTYTGAGTVLGDVSKHLALFHGQRAIAELSYDVARPIKSFEYELVGSLALPLPKDYVALNGVYFIDDNGWKHELRERRESSNPTSPLQDENGYYLYTADGDILENSNSSETQQRYQDSTSSSENEDELTTYYGLRGLNAFDATGSNGYSGRRFGLKPEFFNYNGTYVLDDNKGLLTFDNKVADKIIVVDYVTDGLDEDINDIKIHKFLEEAVYTYMRMMIAKSRIVNLGDKQLLEKDYAIQKRRAKHRLSKINAKEIMYVLKNKSQWIKT